MNNFTSRDELDAALAETEGDTPTELDETRQLSRIYRTLLTDLEAVANTEFADEARYIQLISDAVGQALNVMSQRCPRCDSSNIVVICNECSGSNIESYERDSDAAVFTGGRIDYR